MAFFDKDFLQFFIDLAPNNNKDWFDLNRKRYEDIVREPFKDFVMHMIGKLEQMDSSFKGLDAKDCIFRINRDIRFSKDKTPYKLMVSAVLAPEGKKSKAINGIYFEFGPEHARVYGGIYDIDKDDLSELREAIADDTVRFQKLYKDTAFTEMFGSILGEKHKRLPAELRDAAEQEPLIYNKQWYFYTQFDPEIVFQDDLDEILLNCYKVGKPMEDFFNEIIRR